MRQPICEGHLIAHISVGCLFVETSLVYKKNDALIETKQPKYLSWTILGFLRSPGPRSTQILPKPWFKKSLENLVMDSFFVVGL